MVTRIAGNVALDLANTLEGPIDAEPDTDHVSTPADLGAWLADAGLEPAAPSAALLARAHALRAAIYDVFSAVATGEDPPAQALEVLVAATAGARLAPAGERFALDWGDDPLAPIAQAGVDLLRGGPLDRVKLCDVCRWLFVDASRNRSRRWCSMNECGGREKMQRYRARRTTGGRRPGSGSAP